MRFSRRSLLGLAALACAGEVLSRTASSRAAPASIGGTTDFGTVMDEAETLSRTPYEPHRIEFPETLADLDYDQYRTIRFREESALWRGEDRGFTIDLFHPGFFFRTPVEIYVVADGRTERVAFSGDMFDYTPPLVPPPSDHPLEFSGFRLRYPINRPGVMDEFIVFQGASYFRAVARGQRYGLSARGLALYTAEPQGEEFPDFVKFWLIRPQPGATSLVVLALLDSPSVAGAYRFTIRPGEATVTDVEMVLYPRVPLDGAGLAPLTSMYLFGPADGARRDDFRDAVHDSSGLQIVNGAGEQLWRPLANPARLQVSAFVDRNPRGFGLVQRTRRFIDFHDLEARYDLRPSAWVEPIGDWGAGAVNLIEIPTTSETNDNIVAYWRPAEPVPAGGPFALTYRLTWTGLIQEAASIGRVTDTRSGTSFDGQRRLFIVEFTGIAGEPVIDVSASAGTLTNVVGRPNPLTEAYRVSFELDTGDATLIELRLILLRDGAPVSETWLYRWTAA